MDKNTLPPTAFQFLAPAAIQPKGGDDATLKTERTLTGIAYGGDVVTDSGYWSNLVIDLASISIETPMPLLSCHNQTESIGMVTAFATTRNQLTISARLFSDIDDDAAEIAAKADKGFPWQLSVGIWPQSIEEVQAGAEIPLNGKTFKGPLTVFRNGRIREISILAVGADNLTKATVLNADIPRTVYPQPPHENQTMNELEKLKADFAELQAKYAELSAAKPDPAKYVPVDTMQALQTKLAELTAKEQARTVDEIIQPALVDGRLMAAQEPWARELGTVNLKALQDFLAIAQPIAALNATQTGGKTPAGGEGHDAQTLVQLAAKYQGEQRALGIEVDDITAIDHVRKGGAK